MKEQTDLEGAEWETSSPETTMDYSAAGYFSARQLAETLHLPIGLVINSQGGSRTGTWMTEKTLVSMEGTDMEAAKNLRLDTNSRLQCLYNIMLLPVKNYTARGFLWYQGRSNLFNYQIYTPIMTAIVQLWRDVWETPDTPFYYVRVTPHKHGNSRNINSALLQEAQMKALQTILNSGMIPTIDVGNEFCIYPPQKNVVGLRLANLAPIKAYGLHKFPSTEPMVTKMEYSKNKAIVTLGDAPSGLASGSCELEGLEIAGADKKFYPVKAQIAGRIRNTEVWSDQVVQPVAVRYAFRNYVGSIILRNTLEIVAFPFRTDTRGDVK